ncbi:hypothetical protein GALMADRAFT_143845 [Galerina marginata CBS 339.88]|uniref:BTB domain-containing protein n=1 Tax=Galerina marginata (strain CBS 339.88) TaxID=685588 RepID=A0A067SXU5_GALM3|nr:hypothetical protein GALMADRAFT_143845 [Galerina marginata CBS 339.88]
MPPAKRKRTEANEEPEEPVMRSSIWYDDGSIVLEAEKTQFRVHRSVLSKYSKFFKDLFTVPQPEGELLVDGCPVVRMSDSAEDWESLLIAIYSGPQLYNSVKSYPLKLLIAMLRLGNKYDFEELRDHALARIKLELPSKLSDWDALFQVEPEVPGEFFTAGIEFDLVNIAEELGIRSILPMAYHLCIRDQTLDAIFNGCKRPDGTLAELSPSTRYILLRGKGALVRATLDETFIWIMNNEFIPSGTCFSPVDCEKARVTILEESIRSLYQTIACALDIWDERLTETSALCAMCQNAAQSAHQEGREIIWGALPSYFGLPGWGDLKDFEI